MIKKVFILFSIYILIFIVSLFSCDVIEPCGPFPDKFKILGFESREYDHSLTNSESMQSEDTIKYDNYVIVVEAEIETYYAYHTKGFLEIVPSLYACSPIIPTSDERIKDIEITSNVDYSNQLKAGSNLAKIFDISVYENSSNSIRQDLVEFLSAKPNSSRLFALFLNQAPEKPQKIAFTIKYFQEGIDFEYFEITTRTVFIDQ